MTKNTQSDSLAVHDVGAVRAAADVPRERGHFRALVVRQPELLRQPADERCSRPLSSCRAATRPTRRSSASASIRRPTGSTRVVFVKQSFGYGGDVCSAGIHRIRPVLSVVRQRRDVGRSGRDELHRLRRAARRHRRTTARVRRRACPCTPPRKWCTVPNVMLVARDPVVERGAAGEHAESRAGVGQRARHAHPGRSAVVPQVGRSVQAGRHQAAARRSPNRSTSTRPVTAAPKKALGVAELQDAVQESGRRAASLRDGRDQEADQDAGS